MAQEAAGTRRSSSDMPTTHESRGSGRTPRKYSCETRNVNTAKAQGDGAVLAYHRVQQERSQAGNNGVDYSQTQVDRHAGQPGENKDPAAVSRGILCHLQPATVITI